MIPGIETPSPPQGSELNRSRKNSHVNIHNPTDGKVIADGNTSNRNTSQYNIKNTLHQTSKKKQLSILNFLPNFIVTPPIQQQCPNIAPFLPVKANKAPALHLNSTTITPTKLQFSPIRTPSNEKLNHPSQNTRQLQPTRRNLQTKITQFFKKTFTHDPITSLPQPSQQRYPVTPSSVKRNAVRQKLLNYHVKTTLNTTKPRISNPLPHYDLLDSWGHSLPVIDSSTTF
jgi:hypothetical protein